MLLAPYPNTSTDENYGFCSNNQNIKYTLIINEFGYGVAYLTWQHYNLFNTTIYCTLTTSVQETH